MRNCPEIISTFQDATRYPLSATRKGQTVYAFAGSGQRAASLKMWKLIKDNP